MTITNPHLSHEAATHDSPCKHLSVCVCLIYKERVCFPEAEVLEKKGRLSEMEEKTGTVPLGSDRTQFYISDISPPITVGMSVLSAY